MQNFSNQQQQQVASSILIKNGKIVCDGDSQPVDGDILIVNDIIADIGPSINPPANCNVFDASGLLITPGGIDASVHLQAPQGNYNIYSSDDFRSGSIAAALGGTTTIIDFINPQDGETLQNAFLRRKGEAEGKSVVDFAFHMIIPRVDSNVLSQIPQVISDGVTSFMIHTSLGNNLSRVSNEQFPSVLNCLASAGALCIVQCEDHNLIQEELLQFQSSQKPPAASSLSECHPEKAEAVQVQFVLDAARTLRTSTGINCRLHLAPATTAQSIELVQNARNKDNVDASYEVDIAHLVLDDSRYNTADIAAFAAHVAAPPLRNIKTVMAVLPQIEKDEGVVLSLASAHCPFTTKQRLGLRTFPDFIMNEKGEAGAGPPDNPWWSGSVSNPRVLPPFYCFPAGLATIEVRQIIAYTICVGQRGWGLPQFVNLTSTAAAKRFGLYPRKGCLRKGSDADLVVWDRSAAQTLRLAESHMLSDCYAFTNFAMKGVPKLVFVRGVCVKDKCGGNCINLAPRGVFVRRGL